MANSQDNNPIEMLSPSRGYTLGDIDAIKKAWVDSVARSTADVSLYLKRVDQGLAEIDAFFDRPVSRGAVSVRPLGGSGG